MNRDTQVSAALRTAAKRINPSPVAMGDIEHKKGIAEKRLAVRRVVRYSLPAIAVISISAIGSTLLRGNSPSVAPILASPSESSLASSIPTVTSPPSPLSSQTSASPNSKPGWVNWTIAGGTWSVSYPAGWSATSGTSNGQPIWNLLHLEGRGRGADLGDGDVKITFMLNSGKYATMQDLKNDYCNQERYAGSEVIVDSCDVVTYQNRGWIRILAHDGLSGGNRNLLAVTLVGDRGFEAGAIVPNGERQGAGMDLVDGVFQSFEVR